MGNKLAEALNLAGIALYNLHICQRLLMGSMPALQHANYVPAGYQGIPAHTNHSRLHFINQLACQAAGIDCGVHTGVTKLQVDNGEKCLPEYLGQQLTRNENLAPHPETSRCMCSKCGMKIPAMVVNPYAKKRKNDDCCVIKTTRKRQRSDVDEPVELVVPVEWHQQLASALMILVHCS
jgi:hypothetical protein